MKYGSNGHEPDKVSDFDDNYENGWIKLYRSIKTKSWYNKPEYLAVWIHLLIEANHSGKEFIFHGEPMKLNPGQLVTGRKKIAKDLGISESKVQRVLSYFETKERQIEQRTDRQRRVISILNWNQYQKSEQRVNNDRTTSEQRVNTNNNEKNVNNDKNNNAGFYPPTIDEINLYVKDKNLKDIDTDYYFNSRTSTGWKKVNGQFVKNWKNDLLNAYKNGWCKIKQEVELF